VSLVDCEEKVGATEGSFGVEKRMCSIWIRRRRIDGEVERSEHLFVE